MDEQLVRVVVVGAVAAVALVTAVVVRRGAALRRHRPARDLEPGMYVFVSEECSTCARAEEVLAAAGAADVRRVVWEREPEVFRRHGVERVPLIVRATPGGGGWSAGGVPSERRLRRWLRDP